jgi:hypothetical protein
MSNSGPRTIGRIARIIARYGIGNAVNWTSSLMTTATQRGSLELLLCQPGHGNSSRLYAGISAIRILGAHEEQKEAEYFSNCMRVAFPEFRWCENDWKVHAFATERYPDWTNSKDVRGEGHLHTHFNVFFCIPTI